MYTIEDELFFDLKAHIQSLTGAERIAELADAGGIDVSSIGNITEGTIVRFKEEDKENPASGIGEVYELDTAKNRLNIVIFRVTASGRLAIDGARRVKTISVDEVVEVVDEKLLNESE